MDVFDSLNGRGTVTSSEKRRRIEITVKGKTKSKDISERIYRRMVGAPPKSYEVVIIPMENYEDEPFVSSLRDALLQQIGVPHTQQSYEDRIRKHQTFPFFDAHFDKNLQIKKVDEITPTNYEVEATFTFPKALEVASSFINKLNNVIRKNTSIFTLANKGFDIRYTKSSFSREKLEYDFLINNDPDTHKSIPAEAIVAILRESLLETIDPITISDTRFFLKMNPYERKIFHTSDLKIVQRLHRNYISAYESLDELRLFYDMFQEYDKTIDMYHPIAVTTDQIIVNTPTARPPIDVGAFFQRGVQKKYRQRFIRGFAEYLEKEGLIIIREASGVQYYELTDLGKQIREEIPTFLLSPEKKVAIFYDIPYLKEGDT
jgi:predicted transcriptional regulator